MLFSKGVHSGEIAPDKLLSCYPCRTFDISPGRDYLKTGPFAGENKLSGLERDIAALCNGSKPLGTVLAAIRAKYGETEGASEKAIRILKEMEEKYLIIFLR